MRYIDAVKEIQFKLGRRRDLDEDIKRRLDQGQDELELEANLPWFLVQKITIPQVVGVGDNVVNPVAMPIGFIREFEDGGVYVELPALAGEGIFRQVSKLSTKHGRESMTGGQGIPCAYTFHGNNIQLFPQPDKPYDIVLDAYMKDEKGSVAFARDGNAATNLWLTEAPQVLIEHVVVGLCLDLRDNTGAEMAAQRLMLAKQRLQQQNVYRMEYNQLRTMGENN